MTTESQTAGFTAGDAVSGAACRVCQTPLTTTFVDLGKSPLCESYVPAGKLDAMEPFYPLHVYVCTECFLVQLREYVRPEEIFTDYAYFSSYSDTWLLHAERYTAQMTERFQLGPASQVIEIASNDGYLLQYFLHRHIPVLGVEPARNVAKVAAEKGIPTVTEFFGAKCARELAPRQADLLVANNVLAQVPDVHDFVEGMRIILKPGGVLTIEFPHLVNLVEHNQFDTIYHEHFSYFSLLSAERLLSAHGLAVFDVEQIPTHGGSLRLFVSHAGDGSRAPTARLLALRRTEAGLGLTALPYYMSYRERVERTKWNLLAFLIEAKRASKSIAGYGAPGKGNTLLNYCGIRTDFLDYTVDRSPHKQGKYLPGTNIPILHPDRIAQTRPDYVFILPWNLKDEIMGDLEYIRGWGGRFLLAIPELKVC
ncbi:MAG: class I SAM-dependent methyltransferase [Bryobacterales bacterium]|nr:class I SAM-dependent methyltransferase [Bryobacterales bacterium]